MPTSLELAGIGVFVMSILVLLIVFISAFNVPVGLFQLPTHRGDLLPREILLSVSEKNYIYANELVAEIENGQAHYYHKDHLGSSRVITDSTGQVISSVSYYPYGSDYDKEGNAAFGFTGKERDETGFHYFGARYYDSEAGGFLNIDPRTLFEGSPYAYALNNPIKYIDPDRETVKVLSMQFEGITDEQIVAQFNQIGPILGSRQAEKVLGLNPLSSDTNFNILVTVIDKNDKAAQFIDIENRIEIDVNYLIWDPFITGIVVVHEMVHQLDKEAGKYPTMHGVHEEFGYGEITLETERALQYLREYIASEEHAWEKSFELLEGLRAAGLVEDEIYKNIKDIFERSSKIEINEVKRELEEAQKKAEQQTR